VNVEEAAELVREGEVVAFITETAYALGCDATNEEAVEKVFELKGRPKTKKVPVIVDSLKTIEKYAEITELERYLSSHLHPGPLSITVETPFPWIGAWRISSSRLANELARRVGRPVVATSANRWRMPPSFSPKEVRKYFPEIPVLGKRKLRRGKMSTIYDARRGVFIREGAVPRGEVLAYVTAFRALKRIVPDEKKRKKIMEVAERVMEIARRYHRDVFLGGSVAKGTFLRDVEDIDIFFLFRAGENLEEKLEILEKVAEEIGGGYELAYAQHPYVKTRYKGLRVELVPAYRTKPPRIYSAADRSYWHVRWVKKLPERVRREAMLIKAFLKGIGAYGAELKVQGFSGYACEVLAWRFGSLVKFLKNAEIRELSDPVDRKRNVIAAVSDETRARVIEAAEAFLNNPSLKFFFPNKPPVLPEPVRTENKCLVILEKPEIFEDGVWGMLRRYANKVERNARAVGFEILRKKIWVSERCYVVFELKSLEKEKEIMEGPPLKNRKHVERFLKKHRKTFEMSGRVFAVVESRFKKFGELVKALEDRMKVERVVEGREIEGEYRRMGEEDKRELSDFLLGLRPWEY